MKKIFKQCRLALLAFLLILPVSLGQAATEFMPVNEIKPGMHGVAKTVVSGTKLEEFGVEVLGIMENKGATGDLILVRTYGDVIDRTGGIAQGMSGSPVYINDKLVGAVAYGWSLTDHKIGMVTPIGDMLKLWDMPDHYNSNRSEVEEVIEVYEKPEVSEVPLVPSVPGVSQVPGFEKMATPIMVSGFSEHALSMLKDKLKPFNLAPYGVGAVPTKLEIGPLEPGSAIGVELVRGDVSVGALGTVTYIEGDNVLAFGHPFLKKGNVGYFMTNAYIFTTVSGLENSFKVGTVGEAVGTINQDRGSGVAGKLDRYPDILPILIEVEDKNTGKKQEAAVQVVQDEQLFPALTATTLFNVIDKTIDRLGPGTAKVSFEISARNMPGEIIKRENMFYSPANIGEGAVGEFFDAMSMLASNQYNSVEIMDVKVNVAVDEQRLTADIVEAQTQSMTAKPGETIEIAVKLKPYRGETITRVVPFTIPKDQPEGALTLEVRGGGMVPILQLITQSQTLDQELILLTKGKDKNKKFEDVVTDFLNRDRNNDIVVEVFDMNMGDFIGDAAGKPKNNSTGSKKHENTVEKKNDSILRKGGKEKRKNSLATDYIISGDTQVVISVEKTTVK